MSELLILSINIKRIRKTKGETQEVFASHCGLSTDVINQLENVKTDPKLSTLQSIAEYSNVSVSDLLK